MKDYSQKITHQNIFKLLHFSGLTDEQFANVIGVSIRWLKYLKAGKYVFKLAEIENTANFFKYPFSTLTSKEITPPKNFRETLTAVYKHNDEYFKMLADSPSIPYAIEFKLLEDSGFQKIKLEIKEINKIFNNAGWNYKSSSLTNALKSRLDIIEIEPHPTKKRTNLYSKK